MVKNKLILLSILSALILISLNFISAQAVINSISVNGTNSPDNFFSNYSTNRVVNLIADISGINLAAPGHSVNATFTSGQISINCNMGAGPSILLTNDSYGDGIYNGTCDVGDEAALSNFYGVNITILAVPAGLSTINSNTQIILYNMTTPPSPPQGTGFGGCTPTQFGPLTTNFTSVPDFAHVNFVINIQANFTCLSEGRVSASTFRDVMLLNLTSVNLSTTQQAQKLSLLQSALNITLIAPHQFGKARIFIDSAAFQELDTNATIKFFYLPFTRLPNVTADNATKLGGYGFVSNGFDSALNIATVNLTINVTGFSGYNVSDTVNPVVTINSPSTNATVINSFNVTVNGTGTEPSQISISLGGTYIYNSTFNSANCTNISADKETFNCYSAISPLADGQYTISVTAYDYGGDSSTGPGNSATSSKAFAIDNAGPAITFYSPSNNTNYYANQSFSLYFSASDALTAVNKLWYNYNGTTNNTASSNQFSVNINYSSLGIKNIILYANDTLNNIQTSVIQVNITNQPASTFIANDTTYNVSSTTTSIVVPFNSSLQTVTLTNTSQQVSFDLSQLLSGGIVTMGTNNFTLVTTSGTSNYTAFIPSGINITGGAGWDGKINLPTINSSTFNYSGASSIDVVIDMGTSAEVNFSSPVKIVIGGMAGKRAAWSRGNLTLKNIATSCTSATVPGITSGECYADSGSDLIIWTYHFTSFAAYTPVTVAADSGNSDSSSNAVEYWINTFYPTIDQITNGYTKELMAKQRVRVKVSNTFHYVGLVEITSSTVTINVSSKPQQAIFSAGTEKKFDVNNDTNYDIKITLNSIDNGKANITMQLISESIPVASSSAPDSSLTTGASPSSAENEAEFASQESEAAEKSIFGSKWFWIILVIVLVAAGIIFYQMYLKKRYYDKGYGKKWN